MTKRPRITRTETHAAAAPPLSSLGDAPGPVAAGIEGLGDWRGRMLTRIRSLIRQADPDVVEDVKWRKPSNSMAGVPVWSHAGMICTGETYKEKVKLTFARGALLDDPAHLFNSSLEGGVRRAIDLREGDTVDERAFKALIRGAVELNASNVKPTRPARAHPAERSKRA